ncbi:MAG: polyprenyl synthetase family protein [Brevinema sp.]
MWNEFAQTHKPSLENAIKFECNLLAERGKLLPQSQQLADMLCEYTLRGKLLRGLFVRLVAESFGTADNEKINRVGASLELAQSAFLIHDDIMDGDTLRRGGACIHTLVGTNTAICLGDWALLHIFSRLSFSSALVDVFSSRLSSTAAGQAHEVALESKSSPTYDEILQIIHHKTALYTFVLPFESGMILVEGDIAPMQKLGLALGEIFQVRDDELNLLSEETTGKSAGGDIIQNKKTLCRQVLLSRMPEAATLFGKEGTLNAVREAYNKSGAATEIADFLKTKSQEVAQLLDELPIKKSVRPLWGGLLNLLLNRNV